MNHQGILDSSVLTLDPLEAPEGFFAVLKSSLSVEEIGNLCRACDWRPTCQKADTDFRRHNHRCMSYEVICDDGTIVGRRDGCSVVFKRLPEKMQLSLFAAPEITGEKGAQP